MTHTRTMTLEELALDRLCSAESVTLADGTEGVITQLYASCATPNLRRVGLVDKDGRVHHVDLTYGAVNF